MKTHILITVLLTYGSSLINCEIIDLQADEQNNFPPLENISERKYLPLAHKKKYYTKNHIGYKYNQPQVIDDPLPMKVDYIEPLRIDFFSGNYEPIFKEALILGQFYNENDIQKSAELPKQTTAYNFGDVKDYETKYIEKAYRDKPNFVDNRTKALSQLRTHVDFSLNSINYDQKTETFFDNNKHFNKFYKNIISRNYFDESTAEYKLFNSNNESNLNTFLPAISFKQEDDVDYVEDTTFKDDNIHTSWPRNGDEDGQFSLTTESTATITAFLPTPLSTTSASISIEDENSISTQNESDHSGQGYFYEKPKIPFIY